MTDPDKARVVAAIHEHRLAEFLETQSSCERVTNAKNTLATIAMEVDAARLEFEAACKQAGVPVQRIETARQFHAMKAFVAPEDVPRLLKVAQNLGYPVAKLFSPGAARSLARFVGQITLMQSGENTFRLTLQWRDQKATGRLVDRLRPNMLDYGFLRLPAWLGWMYPWVRPVRVLYQKISKRNLADEADTFLATVSLGTPAGLSQRLFEFAGLGPQDCLLDIGCGDGRILVEAVRQTGCRAIGVERNQPLAKRAEARVRDAGFEDRITVHSRLAEPSDIEGATLVFMFHPPALLSQILPMVLQSRGASTRVLVHEQAGLVFETEPDETTPIFAENALTVAHLWHDDNRDGVSVKDSEMT